MASRKLGAIFPSNITKGQYMAQMNQGQQSAFSDLIVHINHPTNKMHRLQGGAGTGKSFFIGQVVEHILKHQDGSGPKLWDVAITATTNKAAAVLAEALPHKAGEIGTIYSFLNLRVSENYDTGEVSIKTTPKWKVHSNTLIIIDECSMINAQLFDYLMKGTDATCKILFVGDKNQLAPVKETISPVYSTTMTESVLTEPVRNAEQPALMDLCKKLVHTVETGEFFRIEEVPGVIDKMDDTIMKGVLEREFATEDAGKRVMCYANRRVQAFNYYIRDIRGYPDAFQPGEIVTNNSAAELPGKIRLYTDQVLTVTKVGEPYSNTTLIKDAKIPMQDVTLINEYGVEVKAPVFVEPEHRAEALRFYSSRKKWQPYFKIKGAYPDLRSVAASTTHKAQGSTYDRVIVDVEDIGKCTNRDQTARMLYVALSRPKQRLFIYGELPERYFE